MESALRLMSTPALSSTFLEQRLATTYVGSPTQLSNYLTLKGSFSAGWLAGWLAGKPDFLQKLKVPEGYEKTNDYSNI